MTERTLRVVLEGDSKQLAGVLRSAADQIDTVGDRAQVAGTKAEDMGNRWAKAGAIVGAAAVAAATAVTALVRSQINAADETGEMAARLNVSTEYLSGMAFAAQTADTDVATLERGLAALTQTMSKSAGGSREHQQVFRAMGVSATDAMGQLRPLEQILPEIADRFAQYADGPTEAALATKLFGDAGRDLLPLLNQGSEGMDALRARAAELGVVIDTQTATAADAFNTTLDQTIAVGKGAVAQITAGMLPALVDLAGGFLSTVDGGNQFRAMGEDLGEDIKQVVVVLTVAKNVVEILGESIVIVVTTVTVSLTALVTEANNTVTGMQAAAAALKSGDFSGVGEALAKTIKGMGTASKVGVDQIKDAWANGRDAVADSMADIAKATDLMNREQQKSQQTAAAAADGQKKLAPPIIQTMEALNRQARAAKEAESTMRRHAQEAAAAGQAFDRMQLDHTRGTERMILAARIQYDQGRQTIAEYARAMAALGPIAPEVQAQITAALGAIEARLRAVTDPVQRLQGEFAALASQFVEVDREAAAFTRMEQVIEEMSRELGESHPKVKAMADELARIKENAENIKDDLFANVDVSDFRNVLVVAMGEASKALSRGLVEAGKTFLATIKDAFKKDPIGAATGGLEFAAFAVERFRSNDSALRAANEVALQIPGIVGTIARAVQAVDSIFGGRLLGTNYEVDRTRVNVAFGSDGVTGNTETRESRQRSLFRGRRFRTTTSDLDANAQASLDQFFEQLQTGVEQAARLAGAESAQIVAGAFQQEFDRNGNLVREGITIAGEFYAGTLQQAQQRIFGESLIATLGQVNSAVDEIAERWRANAADLAEGAQLLLAATVSFQDGAGLLGNTDLEQLVTFVEGQNRAGETLAQTFQRLTAESDVLTRALDILGIDLGLTGEAFVTFASDIAEAAGGLQQANALWNAYFEAFYSEDERRQISARQAQTRAASEFGDIGLDASQFEGAAGMAQFRALFEAALPTLSAEAIVEWLQAADALAAVVELQGEYNAVIEDTVTAITGLTDLMDSVESGIAAFETSTFAERMAALAADTEALVEQARELGATEEQIARIRLLGQLRLGEVLDEQNAALSEYRNFVQQFRADPDAGLSDFQRELARIARDAKDAAAQANALAQAAGLSGAAAEDLAAIQMNAAEQMAAAAAQLEASILSLAEELGYFADANAQAADGYSSELGFAHWLAEQQRAIAEAPRIDPQRLNLAVTLGTQIRDLSEFLGETSLDTMARLRVPLDRFVADFGVSLDQLDSPEVMDRLLQAARVLGIEANDAARQLGVSIGDLEDANSLLNDAFERALARLPESVRNSLTGLLRNVETAETPEAQSAARTALTTAIDALPPSLRAVLAPFLEEIDISAVAQQQLSAAEQGNRYLATSVEHLQAIRDSLVTRIPEATRNPADKSASDIVGEQKNTTAAIIRIEGQLRELQTQLTLLANRMVTTGTAA